MNMIGKNISILYRQFTVFLSHELAGSELTANELMYLGSLYQKDGVTQDELAREFCIDKGATARCLQVMEKKDLIKRCGDGEDRRAKRIYLTEKGLDCKTLIEQIQQKWLSVCNSSMSESEMEIFSEQIDQIAKNLIRENS